MSNILPALRFHFQTILLFIPIQRRENSERARYGVKSELCNQGFENVPSLFTLTRL